MVDYLSGAKKVNRISLVIAPENAPSRQIADKCGFQLIYSLLRDDPRPWHKSN